MKNFLRIFTKDTSLQRLQDNVGNAIDSLIRVPLLDGRIVTQVFTASSDIAIGHKLQREPLGWFVISKSGTGDVWEVSKDSSYLTLQSDASISITFWIF